MLCLAGSSKSKSLKTTFYFSNSNPSIIKTFLNLLKYCYNYDVEKIRCTVQCRYDQDSYALEKYWIKVTKIPKRLFYKAKIDPRTKGKPTKNTNYKGVLRIDYFDNSVRLDLQSLSDLISTNLENMGL